MSRPPIFRDLTLEAAHAAARAEGKLLLVDVMGDWCQPCRQMDKTTWRAPEVEAWVSQKAIAVQIDSEDPSVERLSIRAVPTLMLFRDGTLLDRVAGALGADDLLAWLGRAERGEKTVPQLVEVAPDDIHGRRRRVEILLGHGRVEEATEELAWIWEHALEVSPSWIGVRNSYVVKQIEELVAAHPSARARFVALRDREESGLPEPSALRDWLALNGALGEERRTLDWFDRVKGNLSADLMLHKHTLFDLLVRHQRWADLGDLIAEPISAVEDEHEGLLKFIEFHGPECPPSALEPFRMMFRAHVACIHHAIRASGRPAEAEATAARARELDPSPEMREALESSDPPASFFPRSPKSNRSS